MAGQTQWQVTARRATGDAVVRRGPSPWQADAAFAAPARGVRPARAHARRDGGGRGAVDLAPHMRVWLRAEGLQTLVEKLRMREAA
jgi:hypothetical protein